MTEPPPRPSAAPAWVTEGPPTVTLRYRRWVQVFTVVVMGTILLGLLLAVTGAVSHADPDRPFRDSGITGGGVVIGWCVVAGVGAVLLFGMPAILRFRVQLWPDGFVARVFHRQYRLGLTEVTGIGIGVRRRNPLDPVPAVAVLRVVAVDSGGRRRGFGLAPAYQDLAPALPVLDGWVRARPDLVTGPARALFAERGVLAPEADRVPTRTRHEPSGTGPWSPRVRRRPPT